MTLRAGWPKGASSGCLLGVSQPDWQQLRHVNALFCKIFHYTKPQQMY